MDVYLDTAATTRRKPECVYEAMDRFMRDLGASPGRSVHGPGIQASRIVADAREKLASLLGVDDAARVIFTLNCTEALNLAIKGIVRDGDHVVTQGGEDPFRFLLIAGRPLKEPVARGGPFVMNTRAEIEQAFEDYRNGTLGSHG